MTGIMLGLGRRSSMAYGINGELTIRSSGDGIIRPSGRESVKVPETFREGSGEKASLRSPSFLAA